MSKKEINVHGDECFMRRLGCRLCNVKARRRCIEWRDKILLSVLFVGLTHVLAYIMPDSATVTKTGVAIGICFYLSVLLDAGWFFYLLAPVVRRRIFNAVLFMALFVWGCVLYYSAPVDDSNRCTVKIERQIEAPNRTVAAFFPSRGGFEVVATGSDKAGPNASTADDGAGLRLHYFIFHTSVLFYVALITFSIFGRGIVNNARKWMDMLINGEAQNVTDLSKQLGLKTGYVTRILSLNSLAPDIVEAILAGAEPDGLSIAKLTEQPIPEDWNEQRRLYGFPVQ